MPKAKRDFSDGKKVIVSMPLHAWITFEGTIVRRDDEYGQQYFVKIDKVVEQSKQYSEGQEMRLTQRMLQVNSKDKVS